MRRAREELARREPHNAHDFTYLRTAALAAHAREHGYAEDIAERAFEVFLAARCEVAAVRGRARPDLQRLSSRLKLASLSNGNADLARIGLEHLFALSLNARQLGAAKPARRCFERLAQELNRQRPLSCCTSAMTRGWTSQAARAAGLARRGCSAARTPGPRELDAAPT